MSDIKAKLVFSTGLHCDAALIEIDSNSDQMVIDDIYDCGVYDWIAYNLEIEIPKCSILTINVDVAPSFWGGDIDEINYSIVGNVDIKSINNHDRMMEENAKLREQLKHSHEWLGINSGYHGSPLCVNNEKLLNQLKGQNNG